MVSLTCLYVKKLFAVADKVLELMMPMMMMPMIMVPVMMRPIVKRPVTVMNVENWKADM